MKRKVVTSKIAFTITVLFLVCCFMTTGSWAARKIDFVSANAKGFIQKLNQNGNAAIGQALGLSKNEALTKLRQSTDFNGVTHVRYQQTYKGIPVWGIQSVISRGPASKVIKLHGAMLLDIPGDIKGIPADLNPQGALRQMQDLHKERDITAAWNFRNEQAGTFVYLHNGKAHLCYVVSFFADTDCGNPSQFIYFIDVKTGKVLQSFDMLRYADGVGPGGNLKVGYYYYGTDYPPFCVAEASGTCTMNCTDIKTVDLNHGTSGTTAYSYPCYENTHEEINGAYCPLNDAQYFGQVVFDLYINWYGVPVLPFQLTLRCHYSTNYENAFWDGSTMTFGDGYTTFYPLVALDVVAHEVSHGFTEYNSGLIYSSQSGGINESYSDMAGEAAKYFMRGTNDFMCGYDIFKNPTGALRYLYDPPLDGISIDHVDDYYEGLDVHYSSGIFNKVFYLVATSPGWNTHMAFDIFTKANQDYWVPSSTFVQGAEGAISAAEDYGYNCPDVASAFSVVGITVTCPGPPVADFSASLLSGGVPFTTNFIDQSTNNPTSWLWDFGDGGTSTVQYPTHTYNNIGTYTVTLTATNAYGSDTMVKTNYVTATAPQPPIAEFIASATDINIGNTAYFTDLSLENPTSWSWIFTGGTPATSTAQNPSVTYNEVGTYDVTLVVTNAQGSDTETKVGYISVSVKPYCTSSANSQSYEYIAGVSVSDLNNPSGATPYSDFTYLFTHLTPGNTVNVSLTPGFPGGSYTEYWKIWIDFNDDHDFEDAGEEVFAGSGSSIVSGSFTVPTNTIVGDTRMRVSMSYSTWPPICGTFTYGEVEDYTATILSTGNQSPTADFTFTTNDLTANFTDTSTDPDGIIVAWSWDFGDGNTSDLQNPSHTYAAAGTYSVTLTVTDDDDATDSISKDVTVTGPNTPPTADFTFTINDLTVNFTDASTDPDGTIVGWDWAFGDGNTSTVQNPSHTYASGGTYTVTLTVTDDDGATDSISKPVTVTEPNLPPIADFTFVVSDLTVVFTDTSTDPDGTIVGLLWDFGDGGTSTQQNPTHTYTASGTYMVTLTVTDDDGATDSVTKPVTVTEPNIPPTAGFTYTIDGLTVSFTDTSSDPDGTIVSWLWNFGDGSTSTVQNPIHTYATGGTYTVTLTVTDDDGASDSASATITLIAPGAEMYVYDITQNINNMGKNYQSTAIVTIWDTSSAPVANATVYITWSGVVGGSASGVTGIDGTVSFISDKVKSASPFTITVGNVTHASKTYNPALNNETSDTASY